jgi:hypothetical protein
MSLIDLQNMFAYNQALTATAISHRVIDTEPNGGPNTLRDIAAGRPLYLHILATTTFTSGGASTLTVALESDDNAALTSATVHATVASAVALATLVAGYWVARNYPLPAGDYERYLGLRFTANTANFTGGVLQAWISPDKIDTKTYESAVSTGIN